MIGTCCRCGTAVRDVNLAQLPNYVQLGLRLNTLQHHVTPFCRPCVAALKPADFPTVLANIRATFEHAWGLNAVSEALREEHRKEMAKWEILGFADEIPGLEHGLQRPQYRVHRPCGEALDEHYCGCCREHVDERDVKLVQGFHKPTHAA